MYQSADPHHDPFKVWTISNSGLLLIATALALLPLGCARQADAVSKPKPAKPVTVMTLDRTRQLQRQLMTGSVAPWKTEQVGFEVTGRISFVIEPNEDVQPRIPSDTAPPETTLARVDRERFEIAVESANADVQVAERRFQANEVAIDQRLPAAVSSAKAELQLAEAEHERASRLSGQNAISRSEYDNTKTRLLVARSALASVEAELAQANAEQLALQAQIARARHALDEAKRNLRNTELHSSFRGIVSDVHTVPGSYVSPGDPVVTVQMMDPMLVQFEVSARDSRKYARGDVMAVFVSDKEGRRHPVTGMVYNVDSVADPDSRTYTVALHVRNQRQSILQHASERDSAARTRHIFPLNIGPIITGDDRPYVEQRCLHEIGGSTYVWKITNRKWNQPGANSEDLLTIEPVRVVCGDEVLPLLGQWNFVPVQFEDPASIDIENDLVAEELIFPEGIDVPDADPESWPRTILLEQTDWMLRPGDVVQVAINGEASNGFFVPMKAILNTDGDSFLHVVETDDDQTRVRRVAVNVQNRKSVSDRSVSMQVEPVDAQLLPEGSLIVIGGSHYLDDGDRVRVVSNGKKN